MSGTKFVEDEAVQVTDSMHVDGTLVDPHMYGIVLEVEDDEYYVEFVVSPLVSVRGYIKSDQLTAY